MKIAFVGTGSIAQRHLAVLTTLPEIEVVGHTSLTPANVAAAVARWGGRGYPDIDALLDNETVDAVWVTVPPAAHGPVEYRLLEAGIPFLVEKPLSADRQTAEDIAKAVQQRDAIVAVGYNWRALDTLPAVRQLLTDNPARMVQGFWHSSTPGTAWWTKQDASGGQIVEQATHLIDLARSLLGEAVVTGGLAARHDRPSYPDADIDSVSAALLKFAAGPVGVFSATCLLAGSADVRLQLICEGIAINITLNQITCDYGHERHEFKTRVNSYLNQNRAFIEAVRQQNPSLVYCTYADALETHRLCQDIAERSRGE
jgi:myo-inositol 2-dehydrogenase / D-chiro-inositol 1-dehydrogenase